MTHPAESPTAPSLRQQIAALLQPVEMAYDDEHDGPEYRAAVDAVNERTNADEIVRLAGELVRVLDEEEARAPTMEWREVYAA